MYRVTYEELLEILEKGGCAHALSSLKEKDLPTQIINTIEVEFDVDDEGTEDEVLTVTEFNLYLATGIVMFGVMFKHEPDFVLNWARTKPRKEYKRLNDAEVHVENIDKDAEESLEHLQTLALDACEYRETSDERNAGYAKVDKAYAAVKSSLEKKADRLNMARNRVGDLSRVIEKLCGNGDTEDEINTRIDEIYELLKGE